HFFVLIFFFFQAEDGIRDATVTGVQTCALPILLSTNGDTHLGGDDIDNLLQALFHEKILQQHRVDFSPRAELAQELRTALIRVKHELSEKDAAALRFPLPNGAMFVHDFTRGPLAAVQADILERGVKNMLLLDVTPLSLGIETYGGAVAKIIPRNSTIPASAQELYTTGVDNQTGIDIHVLQGEREMARDCRSLARFTLKV